MKRVVLPALGALVGFALAGTLPIWPYLYFDLGGYEPLWTMWRDPSPDWRDWEIPTLIMGASMACTQIAFRRFDGWILQRKVRRWLRDVGHCGQCDYDLAGNVSGVCPECGTELRQDQLADARDSH
jgi:hypothetical protein